MDYYQNCNGQNNSNQSFQGVGGFTIASLVCGVIAIAGCCTGIVSLVAGSLGILFGILSRRKGQQLSTMSTVGICLSGVGLALGVFLLAYSGYIVFYGYGNDPAIRNELDSIYLQMYGVEFDEFLQQMYRTPLQ